MRWFWLSWPMKKLGDLGVRIRSRQVDFIWAELEVPREESAATKETKNG